MDTVRADSPPTDDRRWQAVISRDRHLDGAFVYAVRSTGIFCRPSCPSRRPRRNRVLFFTVPEAARLAGFRPCRRCHPEAVPAPDPVLERVRSACRLLEAGDEAPPKLAQLAAALGVNPHHLQRQFTRALGVSPRRYAEALRLKRLKAALKEGEPVAQALYGAGFGSSSRLYEAAPARLGMTPASYARGGRGARLGYATAASALGRVLVAATERGIAMVALGEGEDELVAALRSEYPLAEIAHDTRRLKGWLAEVLRRLTGREPDRELSLDVRATAFQARVWAELYAIPRGEVASYGEIAAAIGRPGAARAVGRACASNPVAGVVPCHRAVGGDGGLNGYAWGVERKRALIAAERRRRRGG